MALYQTCYLFFLLLTFQVIVLAAYGGYGNDPITPKSNDNELLPQVFSVQGIVYCKSGTRGYPLKGVVVRITCLGRDKYGYETAPFSMLTRPTDSNGYFLSKLSSKPLDNDGCKISHCKAFLQTSPLRTCQIATDINRGVSGAPISAYRTLGSKGLMRLYSVGPFVYTSVPQKTSSIGY